MRRRSKLVALALAAAAATASALPPQATPPRPAATPPPIRFGVEVHYVEVDAIVTDREGRVVRDLTRDDFEIKEQGKPRPVEVAALVDLELPPLGKRPLKLVEPDVKNNVVPFQGRLYIIVLDDLHTAALRSQGVKQAARRFIEQYFGDQDLAAVVYTSGRGSAGQELTGSRSLLLASVERFMGQRLRSATLNKIDAYNQSRGMLGRNERIRDPEEFQRGYNARAALDTLKGVADWLRNIHGRRKAVLYISEGIDYDVHDPFNNSDASTILGSLRDVISAATRANVSFYTVDPRGLHAMGDETMELTPVMDDPRLGLDSRGLDEERRLAQDSLRVIADETVGRAAVSSNDFAGAFERIVKDNSSYYVLGFRPASERADGSFHSLEVRVKRPGLVVRARNGYSLARETRRREAPELLGQRTPARLKEMLNWPLQQSGLPMAVHAAVFKGEPGKASVMVTVQFSRGSFRYTEDGGLSHEVLDLTVAAVDAAGKLGVVDSQLKLDLKPQTRKLVDAAGFRCVTRIDLAPGRYQLRVVGRAQNASLTGSVYYDLEVPDFAKAELALSGIALSSAGGSVIPTAGVFERLKGVQPAQPTVFREFLALDTLGVVAEVYDKELKTPHALDIVTSVVDAEGIVRFHDDQSRNSEERASNGGALVHKAIVPLKDLAPGNYTLRLEAASRLGKQKAARREIEFRVVPPPSPG